MKVSPFCCSAVSNVPFSRATSARSSTADRLNSRCTISCTSPGSAPSARRFASNQNPSHMWFVTDRYVCTSYSRAASITASGFSSPSTSRVCNAE